MNIRQAKQIPLVDLLARLGFFATRKRGNDWWYFSPFRTETEPSFHIDALRNIWFDFGEDEGGDIINFLLLYYKTDSISDVLSKLDNFSSIRDKQDPKLAHPNNLTSSNNRMSNIIIKSLSNKSLLSYLSSREIKKSNINNLHILLEEIHYDYKGKHYFAIAFKNNLGGYEMRNKYSKRTFGKKDVSSRNWQDRATEIQIFEGFIDYLSAVALGVITSDTTILVLNSLTMKTRAIELIKKSEVKSVNLYLDNDVGGKNLAVQFKKDLDDFEVIDHSIKYQKYKDLNDFLTASRTSTVKN